MKNPYKVKNMLIDSEILDNKTQTLENALQLLEANSDDTTPIDPVTRDVLKDEQLGIAVECMGTLKDLYQTVSQEGISVYDVQVLRAVQSKMDSIATGKVSKVALEQFEGMFTPTRTGLNQTVSVEAIVAEFGRIVKEWFYKLVDFVSDVVLWVKSVLNGETAVRDKTETLTANILKAKQHLTNMRNLNILSDRKLKQAYDDIQEAIIADPKLPRCKLTLMAFGPSKLNIEFEKQLRTVASFSKNFTAITNDLVEILDGGDHTKFYNTFSGAVIDDAVKDIVAYGVESTEVDYFKDNLPDLDMYQPKYVLQRRPYYVDTYYAILKILVSDLRKIKRFDKVTDPAAIARIQGSVADITKGIKAIERVIETIVKLNKCYFKVSASYINYYSRCFEYTRQDFVNNVLNDLQAAALAKIDKSWDSLMDDLGIV